MIQQSSFEVFLRTGRRVAPGSKRLQVQFNPWHDPEDGRFTFTRQGNYFAGGRAGPSDRDNPFSPKNPRNHSVYTVRRGNTLTRIANLRKGLRVSDLADLNGITQTATLPVGSRLILPNQTYLDAGRQAKNNFLKLAHYMETHNGRLPHNPARAPTIMEQLNADWRSAKKNGYEFRIDAIQRTRQVGGEIRLQSVEGRSRRAQAEAGKPDRRHTDDGGHFIAARFNGPRDWFNHFAQDASFNRGAYRAIEDSWAKEARAGRRVFVDIVPHYAGASRRPSAVTVTWTVDGELHRREFPNERKGK